MMGQYKITLNALYGEKAQVMEKSVSVWVFPWRVAIVVILTLIILGIIGRAIYKNIILKETGRFLPRKPLGFSLLTLKVLLATRTEVDFTHF